MAILATGMDASNLAKAGVTSLQVDSHGRRPFAYSVACIVTRRGRVKEVHSFAELADGELEIVYPDPTTSGGAQWAILALYGSALRSSELRSGVADVTRAKALLRDVTLQAGSLPESARRALTQFSLGYGDALLTYENEALLDVANGKAYDVMVPDSTIHIEPVAIVIDRNVRGAQRAVAEDFVEFLWSAESQEAMARNHFRVYDESAMALHQDNFAPVADPFTIEYFGGWERATEEIIEGTWKHIQREIN